MIFIVLAIEIWILCGLFAHDDYDRWCRLKFGEEDEHKYARVAAVMLWGPLVLFASLLKGRR